jgi:site-specific DNA-cytosine methylase
MKILIACEESQATTKAFRAAGFEAYSCDLLPCSGGRPEWHIQGDALKEAYSGKYGAMIAHPPCTFLSVAGAWAMYNKDGTVNENRAKNQNGALDFVKALLSAPIEFIAIENPVGVISSQIRKPDQIIQPWHFGDIASKSTCLWLKGLPLLVPCCTVKPEMQYHTWVDKRTGKQKRMEKWMYEIRTKPPKERSGLASKTFKGTAEAFAAQWGAFLELM